MASDFYLISRTDSTDYDEYDAIVVRADNESEAMRVALNPSEYGGDFWFKDFEGFRPDGSNLKVDRLTDGPAGLILSSFNAG